MPKSEIFFSWDRTVWLLLFAATALCFLLPRIPPMTDLSQHVLTAQIISSFQVEQFDYDKYFTLSWGLKPNIAAHLLLASLMKVFDPYTAAKAYLVLFLVLLTASAFCYAKSCGSKKPEIVASAALLCGFLWPVFMGFLPYIMTFPFFLFALAVWMRLKSSWVRAGVLCCLMLGCFMFHIIGGAVLAFSLCFLSFISLLYRGRTYLRDFLLDAAACLPVLLCIVLFSNKEEGPGFVMRFYGPLSALKACITYTFGSFSDVVLMLLLSGFFMFWVVAISSLYREKRWIEYCPRFALGVLSVMLMVISVLSPIEIGIFWPAGPRVLPYALLTMLPLAVWNSFGLRIVRILLPVIVLSSSVLILSHELRLQDEYEEFLSGMPYVEQGSKYLPIVPWKARSGERIEPFWSIESAYAVYRGGAHPYVFAAPYWKTGSAPLSYRDYASFPEANKYGDFSDPDRYSDFRRYYDHVILWLASPALKSKIGAQMRLVYSTGRLDIFSSEKKRERAHR